MGKLKEFAEAKNFRFWTLAAAALFALALLLTPVIRWFDVRLGSEIIYIEVDQKSPIISAEGERLALRTVGTTLTLSDGDEARTIKKGRIYIEMTCGENGYWSVSGYRTERGGEPDDGTALIEAWVDRVDTVTISADNEEARSEIRYAVRLIYGFSSIYLPPDTVEGAKGLMASGSQEPICIALRLKGTRAITQDVYVGDIPLSDYVRGSVLE